MQLFSKCVFTKVLSRRTYIVFIVGLQDLLTVRVGTLMDEAIPCANKVDTVILWGQAQIIHFYVVMKSKSKEKNEN